MAQPIIRARLTARLQLRRLRALDDKPKLFRVADAVVPATSTPSRFTITGFNNNIGLLKVRQSTSALRSACGVRTHIATLGGRPMPSRRVADFAAISAVAVTILIAMLAARAQADSPGERQVYLVRQDQSDCTNTTVPSGDSPNVGGDLSLSRGNDGNTTVKVAMTASPDTTYRFYLKCVRQLGDIQTGDEGTGFATFTFPTNSVGSIYAFDMYPDGAPCGNKFQSATVSY